MRSDKLIDVASAAEIVIYNNDLVGDLLQGALGRIATA